MTDKQAIYREPWPDRWERLTGIKPDVVQMPSRSSPFGVTYNWNHEGEVKSSRAIYKGLPKRPRNRKCTD